MVSGSLGTRRQIDPRDDSARRPAASGRAALTASARRTKKRPGPPLPRALSSMTHHGDSRAPTRPGARRKPGGPPPPPRRPARPDRLLSLGRGPAHFGLRGRSLWVTDPALWGAGPGTLGSGPATFGVRACYLWGPGLLPFG